MDLSKLHAVIVDDNVFKTCEIRNEFFLGIA